MAPHETPDPVVRSKMHDALTSLHQAGYGDVSIDESIEVAEDALMKAWLAYTGETWEAPVRWLDDDDEGTTCPVCRGTGSYDRDSKCDTCNGTGIIEDEEDDDGNG